ncbi:MAG: MG2 domain-containing protein [Pirellulaceae bacterium]
MGKTRQLAGQFADAARLQGLSDSSVAPSTSSMAFASASIVRPTTHPSTGRSVFRRLLVIAACFALIIVGARFIHSIPTAPVVPLRVSAEAIVDQDNAGGNRFRITTQQVNASTWSGGRVAFQPVPAMISLAVVVNEKAFFQTRTDTGSDGVCEFAVPSDLRIPESASLRVTAYGEGGVVGDSSISVPLEPTRCQTFLTTDKPIYRPGETIWFRSLTLERSTMKPNVDVPIRFELLDPSDAVISGAAVDGVSDRGVGNGSFTIPQSAAGGEYTLVARSLDGFFPEESRKLQVRGYRVPRFKKQLEFRRRSYGPGDDVQVDFSATRAEGGPLVDAELRIVATVDGDTIYTATGRTEGDGSYLVTFSLPRFISTGDGRLSIMIDDGGTRETATETIPIQIGRVDVEFYPEGGYLVSELKNRVYFVARNPMGQPIHIEGEIVASDGRHVTDVATHVDGMGRFAFVPEANERYLLKITSPTDIANSPELPTIAGDLPVIETGGGVFDVGQPIGLTVRSHQRRTMIVQASCRGRLLYQKEHVFPSGATKLSLPVPREAGGVVRLTLLSGDTKPARPLVERLVYCRNDQELSVNVVESGVNEDVQAGSKALSESESQEVAAFGSPGRPMRLTLQVTDGQGRPTPAMLGVVVVDDAALSMDDRERPMMRTHFLLTGEIEKPEDLEHANFYLSDSADANKSLDLLLGTQGWRRFVRGESDAPNEGFSDQLARLMKLDGGTHGGPMQVDNRSVAESYWSAYVVQVKGTWRRLWSDMQFFLGPLLLVWLVSLLFKPRPTVATSICFLFVACAPYLMLLGCGAAPSESVATGVQASADAALEKESSDINAPFVESFAVDDQNEAARDELPWQPPTPAEVLARQQEASRQLFGNEDATGRRPDGSWFNKNKDEQSASDGRRIIDQPTLDRLLQSRGLNADSVGKQLLDDLRFPIRQYAHQHRVGDQQVREDFAETLFWQPLLITDSSGRATIKFDLSDSITTFGVHADAHTVNGQLGSGGGSVVSRIPLRIEPKLPLVVSSGDRIDLPVSVSNSTSERMSVQLSATVGAPLRLIDDATRTLQLESESPQRSYVSIDVLQGEGDADAMIDLNVHSTDSPMRDSVRRSLLVESIGYPQHRSLSGILEGTDSIDLSIPDDAVPGSVRVTMRVYPSPLADLITGVESILREPHGCFRTSIGDKLSQRHGPSVSAAVAACRSGNDTSSERLVAERLCQTNTIRMRRAWL